MAGPFFFAWCDATELSSFGPAHEREDEEVFSLHVSQAEGEFPTALVDVRNPRVGLLGPGRKQWAWISWRDPEGVTHPLMFGRIVGVPEELQDAVVRLTFVAKPSDYEDQLESLADSLRVLPWWDPVFFSETDLSDPDKVLEARTALWHIDRNTHVVTISDIVEGEDGVVDFGASDALYDSVSVGYTGSPASRVDVEAQVRWDQAGSGEVDVGRTLRLAFAERQGSYDTAWGGAHLPNSENAVSMLDGQSMIDAWPAAGAALGGGWVVAASSIVPLTGRQRPGVFIPRSDYPWISGQPEGQLPHAFSGGGFVAKVIDKSGSDSVSQIRRSYDILWLPLWKMRGEMTLQWQAKRARTEAVQFSLTAGVQPILTDPDDAGVIKLGLGPAYVDTRIDVVTGTDSDGTEEVSAEAPIGDARRPSYFKTDRGRASLEHVIARARAQLIARARAVEIRFEVPFQQAIDLSCRKSATLTDPRLPGGVATGKVKSYSLAIDGQSGEAIGSVIIGCTVGRDGVFTETAGSPVYVDDGYVDAGYQVYDGQTYALTGGGAGQVGYEDYTGQAIDDDGVDLFGVDTDFVKSCVVTGGREYQQEVVAPNAYNDFGSVREVVNRLSAVTTSVRLEMTPVAGGPFETVLSPVVSQLGLPKQIDLEAS